MWFIEFTLGLAVGAVTLKGYQLYRHREAVARGIRAINHHEVALDALRKVLRTRTVRQAHGLAERALEKVDQT